MIIVAGAWINMKFPQTTKETCATCGKIEEVRYAPYYCYNCKQEKCALCINANCDFQEYTCQECEDIENEIRYQNTYEEYKENGWSGDKE